MAKENDETKAPQPLNPVEEPKKKGREKRKEKKKKKRKYEDEARNVVQYTYRDMGQDYIMHQKMMRAIIWSIIMTVALAVFIALYISESRKVQRTYKSQYITCIGIVREDIESYENADGNLEFRYNKLVSDMNSVNSFVYLLDYRSDDDKKKVSELYTVLLKYPNQMKEKLTEVDQALADMEKDLDKGYEKAGTIVDGINLKGD